MTRLIFYVLLVFVVILIFVINFFVTKQFNERNNLKSKQSKDYTFRQNLEFKPKRRNEPDIEVLNYYDRLMKSEAKTYSQNGEDGVLQELLKLSDRNFNGSYVEIGCEDGTESNTRLLRENFNWNGVSFDYNNWNLELNVKMQKITHLNVLSVFNEHKVDKNLDLLSIDTDFSDYWILEKILTKYRPKYVIHEVNQQPPDECVTVNKLNGLALWDNNSKYYGASVCAYYCLAIRFGYSMVYCESQGINCFWVSNEILEKHFYKISNVQFTLKPHFLAKKPKHEYNENNTRNWHVIDKCFKS